MLNRVCEDEALLEDAIALARRLAEGPTMAFAMTRRLYWASPQNSFDQQLDMERQEQRRAGQAEDVMEGIAAFLQKRPARFTGK
ncbi:MAG TPA: enoyl-CoA hydratase-related protein [Rhizomicrobium sp.]|jgi:2-(1,2-epoxy-1,2-dihydrophenyl)acetyl-CoA isomerase|nr:enoyl-CoA hydratase-related protein [Rhizomicrobium sp.]